MKNTRNYRSSSLNQLPTNPSPLNPFSSPSRSESKFPYAFSLNWIPLFIFLVLGIFLWRGLNIPIKEIPLALIETPMQTVHINKVTFQTKKAVDMYSFSDRSHQQLFNKIVQELRCSVCQNQNLMDSAAPFAEKLRQEIYQLIQKERSEQEILAFVTKHYGEFVLYRPPVQWNTVVLWFGPFLIFMLGIIAINKFFRVRNHGI